jgi:hypothetical protein
MKTMRKKITKLTTAFLTSSIFLLNLSAGNLLAQDIKFEATIAEDSLNNLQNIPWGGDGFPYSKVVKIEDSLSPEYSVGFAVFDRHGIDQSNTAPLSFLAKNPFDSAAPGKEVYISFWGAKAEGCFAEMIIQVAPTSLLDPEKLVPTLLEVGIGGRVLKLTPQEGVEPKIYSGPYNYLVYDGNTSLTYSSVLYVIKHRFAVNAEAANILMNAPVKEVKAGVTLAGSRVVFPIGKKTVERWKTVYSVNPTCENLNQ